MKLSLEKIPVLGSKFWNQTGEKFVDWIMADALKGIFQNNTSGYQYASDSYKRLKARYMERTKDSKGGNKGTKVKSYFATSVISNETAFVNMVVSGRTINSLRPIHSDDTSVTVSYATDKIVTDRIIYNTPRGYDIVGLNTKNREIVRNRIIDEYKKRQIEFIPKNIVITVGK